MSVPYFANIQECRSVNRFDKIELRGEGTYGQVLGVAAARASALLTSALVCARAPLDCARTETLADHRWPVCPDRCLWRGTEKRSR
jgi:hypothetical protein